MKNNGEGLPRQGRLEFGLVSNPLDPTRPQFVIVADACLDFEQAIEFLNRAAGLLEKIEPRRGPKRRASR